MPKWHEVMRPVLETLSDGKVHTASELFDVIVEAFSMTEDERTECIKSGTGRARHRLYWATTNLKYARLLSYGEKRGIYSITNEGLAFLSRHDGPITERDLCDASPDYRAWRGRGKERRVNDPADGGKTVPYGIDTSASPQEAIDTAAQEIRDALSDELLRAIMAQSPYFFEHLVARLLVAMGYGASAGGSAEVTRKSGDEGIDGIVREDRFGFDSVYYQAKRWDLDSAVGRPEVQAFVGALSGRGADRGLFITTARFSKEARVYAEGLKSHKIALVDGAVLAGLMIDFGVGVSTVSTYEVKALDSDFFSGE